MEICCRHPDWKDIPLTTDVTIKKPPSNCSSTFGDYEFDDSCVVDGVTYQDLEQVPSSDCNECFCDFGEILCSSDICNTTKAIDGNYFNLIICSIEANHSKNRGLPLLFQTGSHP